MQSTHLFQKDEDDVVPDAFRRLSSFFGTPCAALTDTKLCDLPESADQDQCVSQLFDMPPQRPRLFSAPEAHSYFGSPIAETETDVSASPAAMFLSSFSPLAAPQSLPDDEGESVSGYILGPVVGHGGFSIIRRASSPQGNVVAVKIVRSSDLEKQHDPEGARLHLQHEASVWQSLNHEHILPLFSSCHSQYADFFITLYCPAGSLFDILKRDGRPALPQDDAGMMYRQVVKGLRYMHEVAGYVHGDMKLENVLVDEMGVCRIGDFGMAKKIGEPESDEEDRPSTRTRAVRHSQSVRQKRSRSRHHMQHVLPAHQTLLRHHSGPRHRNSSPLPSSSRPTAHQVYQQGSLPYAAPELLMSSVPYRPHPAQDMWALGVMLYALLTGRLPFADSFEPRLQIKILNGAFEMPSGIGRGAERVLSGTLEHSVHDRWTIAMVDEVAWGIGWGDAGDEAPAPCDVLPPNRSRSRVQPSLVPENAVVDDAGSSSSAITIPKISTSHPRSSRSRSRLAAYHPYSQHSHAPNHRGGDAAGWDSLIQRSTSASTGSDCLSPVDNPEIRTPSSSLDRKGGARVRHARSSSGSRSPPDALPNPIETIMRDRGRKALPRAVRAGLAVDADSPVSSHYPPKDTLSVPSVDETSSVLGLGPRSVSMESGARIAAQEAQARGFDKNKQARDISSPAHTRSSRMWPASNDDRLGFLPTPLYSQVMSRRSRSVDFSRR